RAAIWPEATERAELFLRAVELARRDPPRVIAGDAVELLPDLVAEAELSGGHPCVLHSATTGWMAAADRERLYQLLRELGPESPTSSPRRTPTTSTGARASRRRRSTRCGRRERSRRTSRRSSAARASRSRRSRPRATSSGGGADRAGWSSRCTRSRS